MNGAREGAGRPPAPRKQVDITALEQMYLEGQKAAYQDVLDSIDLGIRSVVLEAKIKDIEKRLK